MVGARQGYGEGRVRAFLPPSGAQVVYCEATKAGRRGHRDVVRQVGDLAMCEPRLY